MRATLLVAALVAACSRPPPPLAGLRKAALVRSLQGEVARSVEAEKSAVLATTDEASERFAAESRKASAAVERLRGELRALVTPEEREKLDAFDSAWATVAAVDAQILPLATANTNLKAARLSIHEAAAALDEVLGGLAALEARTSKPERLRELSEASVAALRVQALHSPHIVSTDDAEMAAQEARARALEQVVDRIFAGAAVKAAGLSRAAEAWAAYKGYTEKIFELSRANTNARSFELSIREKAEASRACDAALQALVAKIHDVPNPTR